MERQIPLYVLDNQLNMTDNSIIFNGLRAGNATDASLQRTKAA